MYTADVTIITKKGIDYIETIVYKNNVIESIKAERVTTLNLSEQTDVFTMLESVAQQKLAILNNL